MTALPAPPWHISRWLNTDTPLSLGMLRGRVILLHAFQMLCPGCVLHGLPQVQRVAFPVAIDAPGRDGDPRPLTMRAYALEGTPGTLLYDGHGRLRRKIFGIEDDLLLGAELGPCSARRNWRRRAPSRLSPDGSSHRDLDPPDTGDPDGHDAPAVPRPDDHPLLPRPPLLP